MPKLTALTAPRMRWVLGIVAGAAVLLTAGVILCRNELERRRQYARELSRLTSEVVATNRPLADAFGMGREPDSQEINNAMTGMGRIRSELGSLGPPPTNMRKAHESLDAAIEGFLTAYRRALTNSSRGEPAFDPEFLERVAEAGKSVHQVTGALPAHPAECSDALACVSTCLQLP